MRKAIKLTQENIYNNKHLFKNKKVGDVVIYTENDFPKVFNNGTVNFNADLPDFYEYIAPIVEPVEPTAEQLQAIKKQERNELLRKGIIVNNIWFDEVKLTQFTVMAQMIASIGQNTFEWGFEDGFAPITVQDAIATVIEASGKFQQIYKDNA